MTGYCVHSITALVVNDGVSWRMLCCNKLMLLLPNKQKCVVFFPCPSPSHTSHVTLFHTCLSGQPQHRFWRWLSTGPDHWKHADHRLLFWVLGKQRSLQELLHSLRWGFRNIVGWLEAWSPRGSSHECLWVAHTLDCFISMLSSMIKVLNSLPAFERHLLNVKYRKICNHEHLCSWKRVWIVNFSCSDWIIDWLLPVRSVYRCCPWWYIWSMFKNYWATICRQVLLTIIHKLTAQQTTTVWQYIFFFTSIFIFPSPPWVID